MKDRTIYDTSPTCFGELADLAEFFFPGGSLETDNNGQLVILTGVKALDDGRLEEVSREYE